MSDELILRLLDKVEHRFYGKYRAFVADNADPEYRGRLRLRIPSVLGSDVISGWAMPCAPYGGSNDQGFFFIPDQDAGVWVEFESGLLDYPIWVGTFWSKPGGSTEVPALAASQSPPTSKIIKTTNHTLEFADADGSEAITITDGKNTNTVTLDSAGISIKDNFGNEVTLASGGVTIKSSQIKIGDGASAEKLVLGTTLNTILSSWFSSLATHTHVGNLGAPTSPPVPPLIPPNQPDISTALSQKHVVE
jgi:uncharacterized protein involved in type VI secretion and phage assembly